jgi:hypothetical protein
MASLDFGMAKTRGLIVPFAQYETDIIKKAGGRGVFKSEDWWNKELDAAIKKGKFEEKTTERVGPNVFGARNRGEWSKPFSYFLAREGYESATPVMEKYYQRRGRGGRPGTLPITTPNVDPRFYMVREKRIGWDATKTKDVTEDILNKVTAQSKRRVKDIKRETATESSSRSRLRRGTGGLMAKARPFGDKPQTGLPALGAGGLGITASLLGEEGTL